MEAVPDPVDPRVVRLLDAKTGLPLGIRLPVGSKMTACWFSPDGHLIFVGSEDCMLQAWNPRTGHRVGRPIALGSQISALVFSPDARLVATGCLNGSARVWNVHTGKPVSKPMDSEWGIASLAFSPDGSFVMTATYSGILQAWDVETGETVGRPMPSGKGAFLDTVQVSPDSWNVVGTSLAMATAYIWDFSILKQYPRPARLKIMAQLATRQRLAPSGALETIPVSEWLEMSRRADAVPKTSRQVDAGK